MKNKPVISVIFYGLFVLSLSLCPLSAGRADTLSYSVSFSQAGSLNQCDSLNCENLLFGQHSAGFPAFSLPDALLLSVDLAWNASQHQSTTVTNLSSRPISGFVSDFNIGAGFLLYVPAGIPLDEEVAGYGLVYSLDPGESITGAATNLSLIGSETFFANDWLFDAVMAGGTVSLSFVFFASPHGSSIYADTGEPVNDRLHAPQVLNWSLSGASTLTYSYCSLSQSACRQLVPEPGSLALLSLALAGLGFARRRACCPNDRFSRSHRCPKGGSCAGPFRDRERLSCRRR